MGTIRDVGGAAPLLPPSGDSAEVATTVPQSPQPVTRVSEVDRLIASAPPATQGAVAAFGERLGLPANTSVPVRGQLLAMTFPRPDATKAAAAHAAFEEVFPLLMIKTPSLRVDDIKKVAKLAVAELLALEPKVAEGRRIEILGRFAIPTSRALRSESYALFHEVMQAKEAINVAALGMSARNPLLTFDTMFAWTDAHPIELTPSRVISLCELLRDGAAQMPSASAQAGVLIANAYQIRQLARHAPDDANMRLALDGLAQALEEKGRALIS